MIDVIIYTTRFGIAQHAGLIRNAGIEPHIIEYLKTPPSREMLELFILRMSISVRDLVRMKGTPYHDLHL